MQEKAREDTLLEGRRNSSREKEEEGWAAKVSVSHRFTAPSARASCRRGEGPGLQSSFLQPGTRFVRLCDRRTENPSSISLQPWNSLCA